MQYYYLKRFPEKSLWADIKFFLSSRAFYTLTIYGYTFSLKQIYTFPNLYISFVFEMKQTLIATWIAVGKDIWLIFNHLDTNYSIAISYIIHKWHEKFQATFVLCLFYNHASRTTIMFSFYFLQNHVFIFSDDVWRDMAWGQIVMFHWALRLQRFPVPREAPDSH